MHLAVEIDASGIALGAKYAEGPSPRENLGLRRRA
jgi:hypothetical protein